MTPAEVLDSLREQPAQIAFLTADLSAEQLRSAPEPGSWSAVEVLAHLRSCNDVWGEYLVRTLNEDRPRIRAVDPRVWVRQAGYLDQDFAPLLAAYRQQRMDLLDVLEVLPKEAWSRSAIVVGAAGRKVERSVMAHAALIARHERTHLRQIRRLVRAIRT